MKNNFQPSINGISFKNYDIIEDAEGIRRVRGDLYFDGNKIGKYDPAHQENENDIPTLYLNIEEKYSFVYTTNDKYESFFNKNAVPLAEYDCPVGLTELLLDLEIITYLYSFMNSIRPHNDFENIGMVGIINGQLTEKPIIKVISIKDKRCTSKEQIIDFVKSKTQSIVLNNNYPVRVFSSESDFTITYINGRLFDQP